MRSMSTIPLLMITPAKLSNPKIPKKSNGALTINTPINVPVKASGMVIKIITERLKESNCQINKMMRPMPNSPWIPSAASAFNRRLTESQMCVATC